MWLPDCAHASGPGAGELRTHRDTSAKKVAGIDATSATDYESGGQTDAKTREK
jgi:hypothetical protein